MVGQTFPEDVIKTEKENLEENDNEEFLRWDTIWRD